jgi:hypothetical protein
MSNRGGKRSTTWKKGSNYIKKKGTKNHKTRLKESLGKRNWSKLESFVKHEGAQRMVTVMGKLDDMHFVYAFATIAEFIMPKLQRVEAKNEHTGKDGQSISITLDLK